MSRQDIIELTSGDSVELSQHWTLVAGIYEESGQSYTLAVRHNEELGETLIYTRVGRRAAEVRLGEILPDGDLLTLLQTAERLAAAAHFPVPTLRELRRELLRQLSKRGFSQGTVLLQSGAALEASRRFLEVS
ncbi:hypothetical protein DB347_17910 [Opitutaceae bacterium EW11]|nr:hypothetical protein DB347_17910 [Opitutaceae bacterium EW11]